MMLSLMYLLIFVVWAIAVVMLKCKNAKAKRQAEEAAAMASAATNPDSTVHVIQIGSNYYDIVTMPQNHPQCQQQQHLNTNYPPRYSQYRSMQQTPVAQSNPAFILDEGGVFPTTGDIRGQVPTNDIRKFILLINAMKNFRYEF
jgi:hypothetical protein